MTVLWQINLGHQEASDENVQRCVEQISTEYANLYHCAPRRIFMAHNGIGYVVGEKLRERGLPIDLISPSLWRQMVDPLIDGPTEESETCL